MVGAAPQVWVDCHSTVTPADGTPEAPYTTIQEGVDNVDSGGTVWVRPGVYDQGLTEELTGTMPAGRSRVSITKPLTLKSTGGKLVTFIRGAAATGKMPDGETPDPSYNETLGLGADAIRCIYVTESAANNATGVRIEGFTIENGYTMNDNKEPSGAYGQQVRRNLGGGVASVAPDGTSGDGVHNTLVVDSTIRNCAATRGGGALGGTFVRCFFTGNRCANNGAAGRNNRLYNCVLERANLSYNNLAMNCTFFGGGTAASNSKALINCLFLGNTSASDTTDSASATNCATISSTVLPGENNISSITAPVFKTPAPAYFGEDWGIVSGGDVIGAGAVELWNERVNNLPEDLRNVDFNGRPRFVDGKLSIGATEAIDASKLAGAPLCIGTSKLIVVGRDGAEYVCASNDMFYSETWPVQYKLRAVKNDQNQTPVRIKHFLDDSEQMWATRPSWDQDGYFYVTPYYDRDRVHKVTLEWNSAVRYVDAENGSDETGDGTAENPYKTITYACSRIGFGTIYVAPGIYSPGTQGTTVTGGIATTVFVPVNGFYHIRALGSKEETIIEGAIDPDTAETDALGCGPKAARAIYAESCTLFTGFTIRNGRTLTEKIEGVDNAEWGLGSACFRGNAFFTDCVLSNFVGNVLSVGAGGGIRRSLVSDCRNLSGTAAIQDCYISDSILKDFHGAPAVSTSCRLYNTTVYTEEVAPMAVAGSLSLNNSILLCGGSGLSAGNNATPTVNNSFLWGFESPRTASSMIDPFVVDAAAGDFRLWGDSPAVTQADLAVGIAPFLAGVDYYGTPYSNAWARGESFCGAVQDVRIGFAASAVNNVTDGAITPSGHFAVEDGEEVTFTAAEPNRNLKYFLVNGVVTPASADGKVTVRFDASKGVNTVQAVYANEWYVAPDGTGSGIDAEHPTSLQDALTKAVAGDTVYAAEGVYNTGSMLHTTPFKEGITPYIPARAFIRSGISLIGAGADKSIIEGAPDTAHDPDHGIGPNAVRGVVIETAAELAGFTVRYGHVDGAKSSSDPEDDNHHAGGILGRSGALIRDCNIVSNNAPRAAGARYGTYNRCRFIGNRCWVNGSAFRDATVNGCFFDWNVGPLVAHYYSAVRNSTFGRHNRQSVDDTSASTALGTCNSSIVIPNVLVCAGNITESTNLTFRNCVFPLGSMTGDVAVHENTVYGSQEELVLDERDAPVIGVNPAVDHGLASAWTLGDTDAAGNPRIQNARMDTGCYEADWKPRYSTDLAKRRLTVIEAPGMAYEGEGAKSLVIPEGTVVIEWANEPGFSSGKNAFKAQVSGTGSLVILLNGEEFRTLTAADGLVTLKFALSEQPVNTLTFTYMPGADDDGAAEISEFTAPAHGLRVIVR